MPPRIGRYEVLGRIGSGGMGVIYSAYDSALGRKLAVKLLNPSGGRRQDARNRLLREAQALARLSHPAVVHVYEVGEFEDQVFIAMEFVEGTTLRKWQSSGERSWRAILGAYKAAAEGLAAGHAAGIVHRDFKPDNVLVGTDGEVRVIDFGLARTEAEVPTRGQEAQVLPVDSELALTKTGTLMGTPAYMAPEQFKGDTADARTDQFAFCVALYEALYGYRPFAGTTIHQLAANVLTGSVEAPPRYTDVPERMYRVLLRGLEVDPVERYDDMSAVVGDLPAGGSRIWLWSLGVLGVLVAIALGSLGAWSWREDLRREEQLVSLRGAYVAQRGAEAEARLRENWSRDRAQRYNEVVLRTAEGLAESDPTEAVAALKGLSTAAGGWLTPARVLAASASIGELQVRQIRVGLGPVTQLAVDRTGETMAIGTERFGVYWYSGASSFDAPRPLRGPEEVSSLAMSDDARVLVVGSADGAVYVWDEAPRGVRVWTRLSPGAVQVSISADGKRIAAGDGTGRVAVGGVVGPSQAEDLHSKAVSVLALSSDGSILASAGEDSRVRMSFLNDKKRWDLPHRPGVAVTALQFGQGQRHLDCLGDDGMVWRISTVERRSAMRNEPKQVGLLAAASGGPAEAVYGPGQPLRVWPDSDAPSRELYRGKLSALAMSADGRTVVAAGADHTLRQWRVVRPSDPTYGVTDASVLSLAHEPVGDLLAIGGSSGIVRIWRSDSDDEESKGQLIGGVHELSFAPGGRRLAALGGLGGITVWDLDGDAGPLSLLPASFESPIGWSDDGSRLIAQNCEGPRRCGLVVHALDTHERLLSTDLGEPIQSFALSEAALHAVMVRRSRPAKLQLFDLRDGELRTPPWPANEAPAEIVAHAFTDNASALRLVGRDEGRLRLWHWIPDSDLLAVLDEVEVEAVFPEPAGRSLLLRTADGDELWSVDEALRRPVGALPSLIRRFELSVDREVLMVEGEGNAVIVHVPTGIRRTIDDIEAPYAWRGLSGFAMGRDGSVVMRDDPSPADETAFLRWLDALTDTEPRTQLP